MKTNFAKKSYIWAIVFLVFSFCFGTKQVFARENVTDWYIQNFDSEIIVNKDSTLDIKEKIAADCGTAIGKHGIFRVLPEDVKIGGKSISSPVELISITDFSGNPLKYTESRNKADKTVTWKIGDADKTVQGINNYIISYQVKNVIRFGNANFDELYWNLTGNFWDLEIDKFHAKIIFPDEVSSDKSAIEYYVGSLNEKRKDLANFYWGSPNILEFDSTKTLAARQGITVSMTFPKNIFTPYAPTFQEKYSQYFSFLIPLAVFLICFLLWRKYGDDPEVNKSIMSEYDAPGNLSPIELGMLMKNGRFDNKLITAEMIYFATRGLMSIKETHEKILFFDSKDYEFTKNNNPEIEDKLNEAQKLIMRGIFKGLEGACLSGLKDSFYTNIKEIKKAVEKSLKNKDLIAPAGLHIGNVFRVISLIGAWLTFSAFGYSVILGSSFALAALCFFLFSFIMPKRTQKGAELNWEIKGFKMFMETVDKDRAAFYEKENIFEKFLPFAIVFGITGIWIKKMKEIYGEDYYATHAPLWYAGSLNSFDADSFSGAMDSLSADIAANTSAPSGSGGGGGAGGGGGGGGGGGW